MYAEPLIDYLLTQAETQIPTIIEEIRANRISYDKDRDVFPDTLDPVLYLYGRRTGNPREYPAITVWQEDISMEVSGPTTGAGTQGWGEGTITIVVCAEIHDGDEELLERHISRYAFALWKFISKNMAITIDGRNYVLTPIRGGRDNDVASLRANMTPGVRSVFWEVQANGIEQFND